MHLGSNGVDRVCSLWKIPMRLHGTNLCNNSPFQPILHRVSSINERLPNAPKHYETHQNMSLGFKWVDPVCSFWKILTRLLGTNLCINSIISARFASTFVQLRNNPKCTQTLWNATNHVFTVQWGVSGVFVAKNFRCDFIAQTCLLIAPVQPILHRISYSNETLPNAPNTTKCSKTWVWGQWARLGAFVAKNSDATLWHKLVHWWH